MMSSLAGELHRVHHDPVEPPERERAVDDGGEEQRVGDRERPRLGRREHPEDEPADDDDGEAEGQHRPLAGTQELAEGEGRERLPAAPPGEPGDDQRLAQAEQEPRNDPGEKQRAEGGAGHRRVEDHRRARRDHRADARRRRGERRREAGGIAVLLHRRDDDRAGAGEVRGRRPDHAAEEHAGQHVHLGEPPAQPADERPRELEQPGGDAARVHQPPGQHEERQGDEHEPVHARQHRLGQGERPRAGEEEAEDHGGRDRDQHRHPEHQQGAEDDDRRGGADHAGGLARGSDGASEAGPHRDHGGEPTAGGTPGRRRRAGRAPPRTAGEARAGLTLIVPILLPGPGSGPAALAHPLARQHDEKGDRGRRAAGDERRRGPAARDLEIERPVAAEQQHVLDRDPGEERQDAGREQVPERGRAGGAPGAAACRRRSRCGSSCRGARTGRPRTSPARERAAGRILPPRSGWC